MSQNHFNYMNGVPVKIAENYKPPQKLALNQSVAQRLASASSVTTQLLDTSTYDFSLERTVLAKMSEWQHVRHRDNCDRKERLRLHQKERQQQLEAKQKQMLTAVSYPSTDDLSSDDDDGDDSGHGTASDASKSAVTMKPMTIPTVSKTTGPQQQFSPPNAFDNILVPTVMGDSMRNVTTTNKMHAKINLQEFENDTSSPFDNIELKTINDLDILAEVWNTSVAINNTEKNSTNQNKNAETPTVATKTVAQQPQPQSQPQPQQPQINSMPVNQNAFNHVTATTSNIQSAAVNNSIYNHSTAMMSSTSNPNSNNFYQTRSNQMHFYNATINNNPSTSVSASSYTIVPNQYMSSNNYFNPIHNEQTTTTIGMAMPTSYATINNSIYNNDRTVITTNATNATNANSKSKSVPDIIQEINTELENSQGKRNRNNSQSKSGCLNVLHLVILNFQGSNTIPVI